jgi:small subunit ribosomal protein S4
VTKILKSKYKISRRLGANVWGRAKDPSVKKNYFPGQHGAQSRRKVSDYGKQLNAKQLLRGYYGRITEKQFRKIFKEAVRLKGDTGENLVGLLERRLDAVVYRLNFVPTIFSARQMVSHKHIKVNGKVVNIPSYRVKAGDVVEVIDSAKKIPMVQIAVEVMERDVPEYLELDAKNISGKFNRIPKLDDVPYPTVMEPQLIVEFYSR